MVACIQVICLTLLAWFGRTVGTNSSVGCVDCIDRERTDMVVYAQHKSGSMFIHYYFTDLTHVLNISFHGENVRMVEKEKEKVFFEDTRQHKVFAPRRVVWQNRHGILPCNSDSLVMIHWRDPRDIMISMYYSFGWSHIAPRKRDPNYESFFENRKHIQSLTVDEYVTENVNSVNHTIAGLLRFFQDPPVPKERIHVSLYDTMVGDFHRWNQEICTFMKVSDPWCEKVYLAALHNVHKQEGKPLDVQHMEFKSWADANNAHVRDGSSNQYLKLLPETQLKITEIIGPGLAELQGYFKEYGIVL